MPYEELQERGMYGIQESIDFAVLEADLGDGYDRSALVGSSLGTREWKLTWSALPQSGETVSYNGATLFRADYLWEFYSQRMREGNSSFIIQSPVTNQKYLAKFIDKRLTYELFSLKLFSTGISVKQRRETGVTVFDASVIPNLWGWYEANQETGLSDDDFVDTITDFSGNARHIANQNESSKARFKTGIINSLPVFRWLASNSAWYKTSAGVTLTNIFIVAKYNAATFAGNEGLVSDSATNGLLAGNGAASTNFFNFSFGGNYQYRLNNTAYAQSAQNAPVNTFGLININKDGVAWTNFQVGRDRDIAGRYWLGDVAEIIVCAGKLTNSWIEEINEYLIVKYALG